MEKPKSPGVTVVTTQAILLMAESKERESISGPMEKATVEAS